MERTMITRKIVEIDEDKCDGCGVCIPSCAEGAIQVIDGKARLIGENLCDGLGNCLGTCPRDAISIEERPAEEFDEAAVEQHLEKAGPSEAGKPHPPADCPGMMLRKLRAEQPQPEKDDADPAQVRSRLSQWPVQLSLLPPEGDIWTDADVLFAADCVAAAMPDFHQRLLAGKTLAIACPKLDDADFYVANLTTVFTSNTIRSITIAHMEVPCCTGLRQIVETAVSQAGKDIPVTVVQVGIDGRELQESQARKETAR